MEPPSSAILAYHSNSTILDHLVQPCSLVSSPTYRKVLIPNTPPVPLSFQYSDNELTSLVPQSHLSCTWSRLSSLVVQPYGSLFRQDRPVTFNKGMFGSNRLPTFLTEINLLPKEYYQSLFTSSEFDPQGNYKVIAQVRGEYKVVTVDDRVPVHQETGKPLWEMDPECPWAILLLKVWAYINGGYQTLMYCQPYEFIRTFSYPNWKLRTLSMQNRDSLYDDLRTMIPSQHPQPSSQALPQSPAQTSPSPSKIQPSMEQNSFIKPVISKIVTGNVTNSGNVVTNSGRVVGRKEQMKEPYYQKSEIRETQEQRGRVGTMVESIIPVVQIGSGDILQPPPPGLDEASILQQTFQPAPFQPGQFSSQPQQPLPPSVFQAQVGDMSPPKSGLNYPLQPFPPIGASQIPSQMTQQSQIPAISQIPQRPPGTVIQPSPFKSQVPYQMPQFLPPPQQFGAVSQIPYYSGPKGTVLRSFPPPIQQIPPQQFIPSFPGQPISAIPARRVPGPQLLAPPGMMVPPNIQQRAPQQMQQQIPQQIPPNVQPLQNFQLHPAGLSAQPLPPMPSAYENTSSNQASVNQPFVFPSFTSNGSYGSAALPRTSVQPQPQPFFQSDPFAKQQLPTSSPQPARSQSNELEMSKSDIPDQVKEGAFGSGAGEVGNSYFPTGEIGKTGEFVDFIRNSEIVQEAQQQLVKAGPHESRMSAYGEDAQQIFTLIAKTKDNDRVRSYGLEPNCASYKVVQSFQANREFLLKIQSSIPHNWNGRYSIYDPALNSIYSESKYNLALNRSFLITLDDFLKIFSHLLVSSIDYTNISGVKHIFESVLVPANSHKSQQFYLKVTKPCVLDLTVVQNTPCKKNQVKEGVIYHRFLKTKVVLARERGQQGPQGGNLSQIAERSKMSLQSQQPKSRFHEPHAGISINLPPSGGSQVSIGLPDLNGRSETIINMAGGVTDIQLPSQSESPPPPQQAPAILQQSSFSSSSYEHMLIKQTTGMCQNETFQGIFNEGNYVIHLKRETHQEDCQYTLNVVSSAQVEIIQIAMSKEEKAVVMREAVLDYCKKYIKNKQYLTGETKKGFADWICCRPTFEEFGYGFLVMMSEEFSHNKIICRFNPQKLKEMGFVCKDIYKNRTDNIELVSSKGIGQVVLFKRITQTLTIPSGFELFLQTH